MKRVGVAVALYIVMGLFSLAFGETLASKALDRLSQEPPVSQEAFDFVVCGDSRSAEPVVLPEVFYKMIGEWNALRPAFVLDVGDLILGGPVPELDAMWTEFEKAVGGCDVPFFPIAGNHDVNPDPEVIKIYEDRIGPLTYSFRYGNAQFIILNTEEARESNQLSPEQVAWLEKEIAGARAKHVFLFMHEPLFGEYWDRDWSNTAEAIKGTNVRALFAGHEHIYRDFGVREGVHYVITGGAGAETCDSEADGCFFHYLLVRVRGDEVSWSVLRPGGVFPADVVTREKVEARHKLQAMLRSEAVEIPWGEKLDRGITISVENPFAQELASKLTWSVPPGWHIEPAESPYTVTARGKTPLQVRAWTDGPVRFPVPVVTTLMQSPDFKTPLELQRPLDVIPLLEAPRAAAPLAIDGVLSEWTPAKPVAFGYPVDYDAANASDLSAQMRVMWGDGYLYFAVETDDNEFHQPYSGDIVWSADSVEMWLDKSVWSFSLTAAGPQVFLTNLPDRDIEAVNKNVSLAVKRDGVHTVYEAAFPASEIPWVDIKPEGSYRFSMLVNDLDPNGPLEKRHCNDLTPGATAHFRCVKVKVVLAK